MVSKAEHLYGVVDDLLLSYQGSKNPLMGVFACEDIATHVSQTTGVRYDECLVVVVSAVSCRGLKLTYGEVTGMVDTILTALQHVRSVPWARKRNIKALKTKGSQKD